MDRPQSFDRELTTCLSKMRLYALKLTRCQAAADDLMHDAVERALRHWDRFAPGTNMLGWLNTIAYHCHMNTLRGGHHKYEWQQPVDADGAYKYPPEWCTPAPQEEHTFLIEVDNVIRLALNPMQQAVIWHTADGVEYDEIATLLNCPIGTVKSRLNRARAIITEQVYA